MDYQREIMNYCPATGQEMPWPSHAGQWRDLYDRTAWLYNPWTGDLRDARDVYWDILGRLIVP